MTVAYHIRMTPAALMKTDALIVSLVQGLFPGVKADRVVFPVEDFEEHRIKTLETLQRRTSKEGVNALRAAQSLEPMEDKEYNVWLDQQKLEVAIAAHATGVTGLTFKLMGPACDNVPGQPMNAGYENIHEFTLVSYLDLPSKKISLIPRHADIKAVDFRDTSVAFSPVPFLHFHYGMPKDPKKILRLGQVIEEASKFVIEKLEESVKKIPGYGNAQRASANIEFMFRPLEEYAGNLQHWLPAADTPVNFNIQSALIPLDKGVWKAIFVAAFQIDSMYIVPLAAQRLSLSEDGSTAYLTNYYE